MNFTDFSHLTRWYVAILHAGKMNEHENKIDSCSNRDMSFKYRDVFLRLNRLLPPILINSKNNFKWNSYSFSSLIIVGLEDDSRVEPVVSTLSSSESYSLRQYQRRGSAPTDLPPRIITGDRRELTRHTSLNGKTGRRKKQLRRRSSGGPETVCLPETSSDSCSRLLLRRPENSDMLLARRRGSLPIEVLTVGHSGMKYAIIIIFR